MKQLRTEWSRLVLQKWNDNYLGQFLLYLHILEKYIQRSDTTMLCTNDFNQKISKKHYNTLLHKNRFR